VSARILWALAISDFRERVRRPAFLAILLAAVALGYAAAPPASANYSLLSVGGYRGVYDSEYLGTVLALMGGMWLSFAGFYVVKNSITRDATSGVGQILAATPVRRTAYTFGKFLSNFMVLIALTAIVALMAPVMQLLRGESTAIDPAGLWLPFLLFPIPMVALTAALAVVFETLRPLRGGLGNVVWFFGWLAAVGTLALGSSSLDPLGFGAVAGSMRADLLARHPQVSDTTLSAGLIIQQHPLRHFDWSGLDITAGLLAGRFALLVLAVGLALLSALWFTRFDPSRKASSTTTSDSTVSVEDVSSGLAPAPVKSVTASRPDFTVSAVPATPAVRGKVFGDLVVGELRILLRGAPRWWLLGSLALILTTLVVPASWVAFPMLPLAWVWPVLILSRLGTQQYEHYVHLLVGSTLARRRRLAAEWLAGLCLTAFVGLGALVRMAVAADWVGIAAWFGGVVFIPSLALALGVLGRSNRLFQGVYLMLWYMVMNSIAALDFMGAIRENGHPLGPGPLTIIGISTALLVVALVTEEIRHARR
jgi:hypothetical protein